MYRRRDILQIMESKETFEKYFNEYYSQVYKYILKRISNIADAEDLAMESFISCYKKFDEFDTNKASFATWLYVVVNNKLKNYYRDQKQTEELDSEQISFSGIEDEIIEAQYIYGMRQELAIALETLPDIQRKIIILKYFNNKSSKEIAECMGMTAGNVRVNLTRAIDKLKKYFDNKNIEWEN